jgi:thiaminase
MAENKARTEHPFKRVLRAYGLTDDMLAVYLRRNSKYVSQMLNGHARMSEQTEWKLRKLIDRLQNPVFPDGDVEVAAAR